MNGLSPRFRLALSFVSGAFFALAAPPTNLYPALWLGTAAYAVALHDDVPAWDEANAKRGRQGMSAVMPIAASDENAR